MWTCTALTPSVRCEFHVIIQLVQDSFYLVFTQQPYTKLNNSESTCLIDLKFSGKRHFHMKNIHLQFRCKRLSMLKVIAPYSTITEPKSPCCQPHAQTIILIPGNRVQFLNSITINSQSS